MAGGVALNSVANGRILRETPFDELYIQPAAGDGGGALGAALWAYHTVLGYPRSSSCSNTRTTALDYTPAEVTSPSTLRGSPTAFDDDDACSTIAEARRARSSAGSRGASSGGRGH